MIWERLSYSLKDRLAEWAYVRVMQYAARTRHKDQALTQIKAYDALQCWRDHIAYPKATDDQIATMDFLPESRVQVEMTPRRAIPAGTITQEPFPEPESETETN